MAIYSPVRTVSYKIENSTSRTRHRFSIGWLLDIETDGTITPEDATALAARIMNRANGKLC